MRVECIDAFYKDIYQKYSKKDAFVENGWTFITFAIKCLESDSISPYKNFLSIKILNFIMRQDSNN